MPASDGPSIAVFDLGGVVFDWDPRHLYRRLFVGDTEGMEDFLATVCTPAWNQLQDAGRSFAEAEAEAIARHPGKERYIRAWCSGFDDMIAGPIGGTVAILQELHAALVPLFALTNWSHETFPRQLTRFGFLSWFGGIVVSGQERITKPDPRIFQLLTHRYGIAPRQAVFVDDSPVNVAAAAELGFHAIHFTGPEALRAELQRLDLLPCPIA